MIGDWTLKSVALPFEVSNTSALLFLLSHKEIWEREVDRCSRTGPLGVLQSRLNFRIFFSSFFPANNLISLVSFVCVHGCGSSHKSMGKLPWPCPPQRTAFPCLGAINFWQLFSQWMDLEGAFPVYARILSVLLSYGEPQPLWVYEWNSCVMPRW